MMTIRERKKPAGFWMGFEEVPGRPGICILRTHPLSRLLAETIFLVLLWSAWLMIFAISLHRPFEIDTFSKVVTSVTSPGVVWGCGGLLVLVSIMALPQTLIFEADAPGFTHIIGFERFGVRFVRPRNSIRGLLLVHRTGRRVSNTELYVTWTGFGLPTMIAEYSDDQAIQDHADYVSSKTGIPKLSMDRQRYEEALRRLRSSGCLSVLLGIDLVSVWLSKGSLPLDTYLTPIQKNPAVSVLFLPLAVLFLPAMITEFVQAIRELSKTRRQWSPDGGRAEERAGIEVAGVRGQEEGYARLLRQYFLGLIVLGTCTIAAWLYGDRLENAWMVNPGTTEVWVRNHFGILLIGAFLLTISKTCLPILVHGLAATALELGWIRKDRRRAGTDAGGKQGDQTAMLCERSRSRQDLRGALGLVFVFLGLILLGVNNHAARVIMAVAKCDFSFMLLNCGFMVFADVAIIHRLQADNKESETTVCA